MPDLAPPRRAQPSNFARGVRREVIMEHEIFAIFPFKGVDDLLILAGPERRHRERLRLASGEQCRAMRATQDADLAGDRSNGASVAAIDPRSLPQNGAADDLLFNILE